MRYRNSEFWNWNSNFLTLQTSEVKKKIQQGSLESKTESEFRLLWGSQKSKPKIGIPNQGLSQLCLAPTLTFHSQLHYY
jgi:hypothetical protein